MYTLITLSRKLPARLGGACWEVRGWVGGGGEVVGQGGCRDLQSHGGDPACLGVKGSLAGSGGRERTMLGCTLCMPCLLPLPTEVH